MNGKRLLSLALSVAAGLFVVWLAFKLIGFLFSMAVILLYVAVVAGVAYLFYRWFNNMLGSGKRLT